jgi:hypothetical protein
MRCPIRRASARLAQSQNSGQEPEGDGNAPSSQPIEQPHALAEVAQDEVMTALSDDQVSTIPCNTLFIFQ